MRSSLCSMNKSDGLVTLQRAKVIRYQHEEKK
jgi:hypothetical protein